MLVFLSDLGAYESSEQRRNLGDGFAAPTSQQRLDSWTGKMRYIASIEVEEIYGAGFVLTTAALDSMNVVA